jgi:transcriptional regulator with XRE-family HTH domain
MLPTLKIDDIESFISYLQSEPNTTGFCRDVNPKAVRLKVFKATTGWKWYAVFTRLTADYIVRCQIELRYEDEEKVEEPTKKKTRHYIVIGQRLLEMRKNDALDLKIASDLTGIEPGYISYFERGLWCPTDGQAVKLAKAYNAQVSQFVTFVKTEREKVEAENKGKSTFVKVSTDERNKLAEALEAQIHKAGFTVLNGIWES